MKTCLKLHRKEIQVASFPLARFSFLAEFSLARMSFRCWSMRSFSAGGRVEMHDRVILSRFSSFSNKNIIINGYDISNILEYSSFLQL